MLSPIYAAGFFDGEGCVSIFYTRVRPWKSDPSKVVSGSRCTVLIANTDLAILRAFEAQFGGKVGSHSRQDYPDRKPVFSWRLGDAIQQRAFLRAIRPHVFVKAEAIDNALEYLATKKGAGKWCSPEEWEIRKRCCERSAEINRRGTRQKRTAMPDQQPKGNNPAKRGLSQADLNDHMQMMRDSRRH